MYGKVSTREVSSLRVVLANDEARGSDTLISTMADPGHSGVILNWKKWYAPQKRSHVPARRWLEIKYASLLEVVDLRIKNLLYPGRKEFHLKKVEYTRPIKSHPSFGLTMLCNSAD